MAVDKHPGVGDAVYLGEHLSNTQLYGIVGPPGPAGPPGDAYVTFSGTREAAAVRFEVDGWEYHFPTLDIARKVREKLLSMTLEGEL